jgi:hypothetical protein
MGCLLGYLSTFLSLGVPTSSFFGCQFELYLELMGFVLVFGSVAIKNWRVYKLFQSKKKKDGIWMKDVGLLVVLGVMVLIELVMYPDFLHKIKMSG